MPGLSDISHKELREFMSRMDRSTMDTQTVLKDVAVALEKIASLEEHKQESRKDVDNLFALARKTDKEIAMIQKDIAVLQNDTSRNTKWVERALTWLAMAGLIAAQLLDK